MNFKISYLSRKAHYYNEDRFFIYDNVIGVIDGATGLDENDIKPSSASILAGEIKKAFKTLKDQSPTTFLNNLSSELSKKKSLTNASAGISFIRFNDKFLEGYTIGDTTILVVLNNQEIITITQTELSSFDNNALESLQDISKKLNISIMHARPYINDTLKKNRSLKNQPNGYSVFEPLNNPNFTISHQSFLIDEVSKVYIFTDGFEDAYKKLSIIKKEDFNESLDIFNIVKKEVIAFKNDPQLNKYPRFKKIDDITVIKLEKENLSNY